jgi:hypothetical protein
MGNNGLTESGSQTSHPPTAAREPGLLPAFPDGGAAVVAQACFHATPKGGQLRIAIDPPITPGRVLSSQPQHQLTEFGHQGRT